MDPLRRRWNGEKFKLKDSQKATNKELKKEKEQYLPYLNSLPFVIDLKTHLVVHAGIRPGVALHSQTTDDLTELRSLGKDRGSVGRRWKSLMVHGDVGLKRGAAQRRGRIHGTWR